MNYYLQHSAKGQTWKKHKYIAKKDGRYIYPAQSIKAIRNRLLMKEQSANMKYDVLERSLHAYQKSPEGKGDAWEDFEKEQKRHEMPTKGATAARDNYVNQKNAVERIGYSPLAAKKGMSTENYVGMLRKKADQSSAAAYKFAGKGNNKRVTDTGTGGSKWQKTSAQQKALSNARKKTARVATEKKKQNDRAVTRTLNNARRKSARQKYENSSTLDKAILRGKQKVNKFVAKSKNAGRSLKRTLSSKLKKLKAKRMF